MLNFYDLQKEDLCFLVVDFQEKLYPIMKEKNVRSARENIIAILKALRPLEIPNIATEQYVKGLGPTDPLIKEHLNENLISEKMTFSCCGDDHFLQNLSALQKKIVVMSGMETHICVLQTGLDLMKKCYQVVVLKDACVSSSKLKWKDGLKQLQDYGALVTNSESFLFYLYQGANNPHFRELNRALKERKS